MDFASVLGQEMAGYATGEVFFTSQALGFRHSHLDSGGYSYDQKCQDKAVSKAVDFLINDERNRVLLTSMVCCLFAREVYKEQKICDCLNSLGYNVLADDMADVAKHIQKMRWQLRLASGYEPGLVQIPKSFNALKNWKGPIDPDYIKALCSEYAKQIFKIGRGYERN
jgi:aldehyde:ferredoxin oxidoreductase